MILFQVSAACLGLTLIICRSRLFTAIRRLGPKVLRCCQCVGFWVGLAISPLFLTAEYCLLNALITSGLGYITNRQYPALSTIKESKKSWPTT